MYLQFAPKGRWSCLSVQFPFTLVFLNQNGTVTSQEKYRVQEETQVCKSLRSWKKKKIKDIPVPKTQIKVIKHSNIINLPNYAPARPVSALN